MAPPTKKPRQQSIISFLATPPKTLLGETSEPPSEQKNTKTGKAKAKPAPILPTKLSEVKFDKYKWTIKSHDGKTFNVKYKWDDHGNAIENKKLKALQEMKDIRADATVLRFVHHNETDPEPDDEELLPALNNMSHIWDNGKMTIDFSHYWLSKNLPGDIFANCRVLNLQSHKYAGGIGGWPQIVPEKINLPELVAKCTEIGKCVKICIKDNYAGEDASYEHDETMNNFVDWLSTGIKGETKKLSLWCGILRDKYAPVMIAKLKEKFLKATEPAPFLFDSEDLSETFEIKNTTTNELLIGRKSKGSHVIIRRNMDDDDVSTTDWDD